MSRERIAQVLKEKRRSLNLSVDEVSERLKATCGIDMAGKSLYSYESGHRQPDADLLMGLCDIYGIKDVMGEFREKTEPPAPSEDDAGEVSIDEVVRAFVAAGLVKEGKDLTDSDLRFLISIVDAVRTWFAAE